jgi:polysaccharide deacetylase 2 family uncharacterized protein YibQ
VGVRPRRRRRTARKLRFRRWLRRQDRFTRGLTAAVVTLTLLVVALIALRPNETPREAARAVPTPARQGGPQVSARRVPAERVARPAPQRSHRQSPAPERPPAARPTPASQAPRATPTADRIPSDPAPGPRAAIIIDDLGQRLSHLDQLAALDIPLSIAVIPGLPATDRTVAEASRRGIEILLHQPMEPHEAPGKNAGAGVLLTSMTTKDLRAQLRTSLAAVPGAVGVNNHMGSRFTEDADGLAALMEELKDHGLFWLDSKTTTVSRGPAAARAAGVPALERDIFLDANLNVDAIRRQLRRLVRMARARGTAIAIGHPHPETIAVLHELRSELLASGVSLVPVSALVRPGSAAARLALAASPVGKSAAVEPAAPRQMATP